MVLLMVFTFSRKGSKQFVGTKIKKERKSNGICKFNKDSRRPVDAVSLRPLFSSLLMVFKSLEAKEQVVILSSVMRKSK